MDLQNPNNLGAQSTDNGVVPNLKWSFSDSKTRIFPGGWVREQVVTDLPSSKDIAAAQQHLTKGALRELHWHRVVSACLIYFGTDTFRAPVVDNPGLVLLVSFKQKFHMRFRSLQGRLIRCKRHHLRLWLSGLQAEWGYVYAGSVRVAAVDEHGENQVDDLQVGDIWYFPKGQAHTIQGKTKEVQPRELLLTL